MARAGQLWFGFSKLFLLTTCTNSLLHGFPSYMAVCFTARISKIRGISARDRSLTTADHLPGFSASTLCQKSSRQISRQRSIARAAPYSFVPHAQLSFPASLSRWWQPVCLVDLPACRLCANGYLLPSMSFHQLLSHHLLSSPHAPTFLWAAPRQSPCNLSAPMVSSRQWSAI